MTDPYNRKGMRALLNERNFSRLDKARNEINRRRGIIEKRPATDEASSAEDSPGIKLLKNHGALNEVFNHVTIPEGVDATFDAGESLRELPEPRKKVFLLQEEALKIVFDIQFKYANCDFCYDLQNILKLRQLSKAMRYYVDKYLFERTSFEENATIGFRGLSDYRCMGKEGHKRIIGLKLTFPSEVNAIKCTFQPPFYRQLEIIEYDAWDESTDHDLNEFRLAVTKLLERVGGSVWSFSYQPSYIGNNADAYSNLCKWAGLMPGLQALSVKPNLQGWSNEIVQSVTERVRQVPFPSLHSLRFCEVGKHQQQFYPILRSIIKSNPWIMRTKIDSKLESELEFEGLPKPFNPNTISVFGESIPPALTSTNWPLKVLRLHLNAKEMSLSTSILFPAIENFKETLTQLKIECTGLYEDQGVTIYLDLPHLTKLTVQLNKWFHKIDFLLPMKSLEVLSLIVYNPVYWAARACRELFYTLDTREKIQWKGMLQQIERSNIAQIFPFLGQLEIDMEPLNLVTKYRRNTHEDLMTRVKERRY